MNRGIILLLSLSPLPALAASKVLPVLNHPLTDYGAVPGNAPKTIDLAQHFGTEPVDDQAVRFTTQFADGVTKTMDMAMFSTRTPVTRTNFLKYVSDGDYANSFIHRSIPGFVIQGGGYRINAAGSAIEAVPTDPAIVNEFGISNTYGTVSMAKLGTDPNSATSQWFVSMGDNSANLDYQNSGFAVFARVTKSTLPNAAQFGDGVNFPVYNAGSPFTDLPVYKPTFNGQTIYLKDLIAFQQVSLVPLTAADAGESSQLTYSLVSVTSNALVSASLSGSVLTVTPSGSQTATATVVVRATDSVGNTIDDTFTVSTGQTYAQWRAANFSGSNATNDAISGPNADADGDGISNLQLFVSGLAVGAQTKLPVTTTDVASGTQHRPRFTFPFRKDIAGSSFTLEKSSTLDGASWTTVPYTEISVTPVSSTSPVNTWVIQAADAATGPASFYRVKFTVE